MVCRAEAEILPRSADSDGIAVGGGLSFDDWDGMGGEAAGKPGGGIQWHYAEVQREGKREWRRLRAGRRRERMGAWPDSRQNCPS